MVLWMRTAVWVLMIAKIVTSNMGTPAENLPPPEYTLSGAPAAAEAGDIRGELLDAISQVRQPRTMDISQAGLSSTPDLDVKNIYYALLAEKPELKYAYDLSVETADGILSCRISYMPHRAGYPDGWQGMPVGSLRELVETAEDGLGEESLTLRITDPDLTPDQMNRALQQVGGGYILCALSRDGSRLVYSPAAGLTMEDCLELLEEAEQLAEKVLEQTVSEGMSQREQALALYEFLTRSVSYDQRYYSDPDSMPCHSRTAIGALRDGTAICGGYSIALQLLFQEAGITCWTVSGLCRGEHHMWNIALLDGQWLWFDATADRSKSAGYTPRHFACAEPGPEYRWDPEDIAGLL